MYKEDHTVIKLGKMSEKVEVTGGIRQGCCISTLLFKLVTFKIIEDLRKEKLYKVGKFKDNSIWLADDATLIADSIETLRKLLNCLARSGGRYGLQINDLKTKIMKVKGPKNREHIKEYETVTETTYLGITIGGKIVTFLKKKMKNYLVKQIRKLTQL